MKNPTQIPSKSERNPPPKPPLPFPLPNPKVEIGNYWTVHLF